MVNKIKFCFWYCLAHTLYFLGDVASKPMSWGWLDGEGKIVEFIGTVNYSIYNWLMIKSSNIDDEGLYGVWGTCEEESEE